MASRASMRVGPLYHSIRDERSSMLSPSQPEIGMKGICERTERTRKGQQQGSSRSHNSDGEKRATHQPLSDRLGGLVLLEDLVANLGQEFADLDLDLLIALLGVVGRLVVHLVDANDQLLDP